MERLRLVVAVAATFVLASIGVAAAADGDPVILGAINEATTATVIYGGDGVALEVGGDNPNREALFVSNESNQPGGVAAWFWGSGGTALRLWGAIDSDHFSTIRIPAGQRKITFVPQDIEKVCQGLKPFVLATTQGNGPPVQNATICEPGREMTIRLTRASTADVVVAFFVMK